jgi:hypothetical protein
MAQLYELPPDIYNLKLHNIGDYKHLTDTTGNYELESDSTLKSLIDAFADHDTNKEKKKKEFRYAGQLWKSIINFSVPKDEHHRFWRHSGLNRMDGDFRNSVLVVVAAFGSCQEEAKAFAIIKLINLIELIRSILRNKKRHDIESFVPTLLKKSIVPISSDINCNALNMGIQLFAFYQSNDARDDKIWLSLTLLIKKLMKEYSADLRPLLEYYLVLLF